MNKTTSLLKNEKNKKILIYFIALFIILINILCSVVEAFSNSTVWWYDLYFWWDFLFYILYNYIATYLIIPAIAVLAMLKDYKVLYRILLVYELCVSLLVCRELFGSYAIPFDLLLIYFTSPKFLDVLDSAIIPPTEFNLFGIIQPIVIFSIVSLITFRVSKKKKKEQISSANITEDDSVTGITQDDSAIC